MPSPEQTEIADTVAALLSRRAPVIGLGRDPGARDIDDALWRECCALGWLALGLPAEAGGVGFGLPEEATLFRELGRGVAPGPFLPGVLAVHLAAGVGDLPLAASIVSGDTRVALGTVVGDCTVGARVSARCSLLHSPADLVLVCTPAGAAFVRHGDLDVTPLDGVDPSVPIARAIAADVPAIAWAAGPALFSRALVLTGAMAVGVAQAAMATAVAYAGQRHQFGKPIGSFQAIKHACADMAVRADGAEAQVFYAAVALEGDVDGAAAEAVVAKLAGCDAARLNSQAAVQVHGAIGFTAEATPYRFVVRANLLGQVLAPRTALLDAVLGRPSVATP